MSTLGFILLFSFIGSIGSLVGGIILLSKEKFALKISHFLAAFAAGTLLGTAFFDLLPEAVEGVENAETNIFLFTLVGILIFFFIERYAHWFHHHDRHLEHSEEVTKNKKVVSLIVIGDTIHNFIDGVAIAATFLVSVPLGIVTALSVATHEIPQEIGDFGLMLHQGIDRKKIIIVNILSAGAAMIGAVLTFLIGDLIREYLPFLLGITAGFFIYIASADLIPEIHHEKKIRTAAIQNILLLAGIGVVWAAVTFLENPH